MEVVVGDNHRPAQGHSSEDEGQEAVELGTGNRKQVECNDQAIVDELKLNLIIFFDKEEKVMSLKDLFHK